jgi:hypothetical protein
MDAGFPFAAEWSHPIRVEFNTVTQEAFKCPPQAPEAVEMMALRLRQDRGTQRRLGRWIAALVALQLLALGSPAWAADVIAVRVGQHPEFTRIVFELDAASGYRVARTTGPDGSATIVVTLDAAARPQTIQSGSALVRSVAIDAAAGKATARIALRTKGLPLKEMILSNPPRIVLDVLGADTALKKKARKKIAKKTPPAPKPTAEAPVQPVEQAPKPATKPPAPAVKPAVEAKAPAPSPSVPKPAPSVKPAPAPSVKPPTPPEPPKPTAKSDKPAPAIGTPAQQAARRAMEARLKAVRDAADARREEAEQARGARETEQAKQRERAEATPATATATATPEPEPEASEDSAIDPMLVGGIAGGVLLLLALLVVMRRRRSLPKDVDISMLSDDEASTPSQDAAAAMTETEFASTDDVGAGASRHVVAPVQSTSVAPTSASQRADAMPGLEDAADPPLSAPGLFDETEKNDEPEKGASTMDQEMQDPGMDTVQSTPMHPSTGTADSGVAAMMRDMERRMAHLESRLEEEMAARERLERQIAAQSEELRVQRAAIARTQRALRGLSRTDEEQATEPALRDPS